MQLNLSIDLTEREGKSKPVTHLKLYTVRQVFLVSAGALCALSAYLLPLVRFGDPRVWDDFGRINFASGEVGHLVAFSKTSLERGQRQC